MVLVFETSWALWSFGMDAHSILEDCVLGTYVSLIQQAPGPVIHGAPWTALEVGFARSRITPGGRDNVVEGDCAGGIIKDFLQSRHQLGGDLKCSTSQHEYQRELP
jgi:hypothetical protein